MTVRDFSYYQGVLARIARNAEITRGSRIQALRALTREVAQALGADYVGFWGYNPERTSVVSEANYSRKSGEWSDGVVLAEKDFPVYFSKLKDERVLPVVDCFTSEYTAELKEPYCVPHDIRSLVDAPVLFDGDMVGIICCEVVGASREWSGEDKFFALSAADFVGRILEADQRRHYERLLRQENLRQGETQLKALLTVLPIPLAMLDRESCYMAMSDAWLQHYKFNTKHPIGVPVWDAHDHYRPEWRERILAAQRGQVFPPVEEQVEITPGEVVWLAWQMMPWHNINGEIGGVLLICEDITFRKESEVRMRQTAKLSALGEMAGGIAHEINNPLSIMKGYLDLMQKSLVRGQVNPESFSQYLERSSSTIQRISRIVQAMKRISRDSSQDPMVDYGVNVVIDEVLDVVREKFRDNGVRLEVRPLADDFRVHCRPVEISQVLLNLLTNAFHAVSGQAGAWVRLEARHERGNLRLVVSDSGPGIHADIREKIFQPFFTTKDIGKGTGLGLSISRRILEGHGGKLYLDHAEPATTFVVELKSK